MLTRRKVILAKIESAYKTDPTLSEATDALQVENFEWKFAGQRMHDQNYVSPSLAKDKQLYGGSYCEITFDIPLKGSGAAGTAPEFGSILRACGFGETVVPATSVTYAPVSTAIESVYMKAFEDGKLIEFGGCRGTFSFAGETGTPGRLSVTMSGHFIGDSDTAMPSPTVDTTVPPVLLSSSFTVDAFSAVIQALNFDISNTVIVPPNINDSEGYGEFVLGGRDVNGSINPEVDTKATKDFIGQWKAGTAMALNLGPIGVAGNQWQVVQPAISYRDVAPGDRDGIRIYELPFGASESTTDDEVSFVFT
jgi:hypothetical protein